MKKTYFVKKNPDMPESPDNWITMNAYEFAMFMKTPEGQERRQNFGQLDACEMEDSIYIFECGQKTAKKWRSEKDSHDYLAKCERESGYIEFSYSSVSDDGNVNGEELLRDEHCNVEAEAIEHLQIENLRRAIDRLTEKEYELIKSLYLSQYPMTITEYAKKVGLPRTTVSSMLKRCFLKLRAEVE